MADYLSDMYPIPVEFVDGQQPTAKFLNKWATQIDNAFVLLSRVLGDYDGTGDAYETYVSNVIRAIGSTGWINTRLPRGLRVGVPAGAGIDEDLPRISETLTVWSGEKTALLSFLPAADDATDGNNLIAVGFDNGEFANPVGKLAGDSKYNNLNGTGDWVLDGRRVLTVDPIVGTSRLVYAVDTDSVDYRDSYGEESGSNVIPSLYEIASALSSLCTISQPAGYAANEYRLDFPEVRRIQNPAYPQSLEESETIELDDPAGDIRWDGEKPRYVIPTWIYNLAGSNGGVIPNGLVGLWFDDGASISRVRASNSTDLISWELIIKTGSAVKITLNGDLELPTDGAPGEANDGRYIVAFAGTSIADALVHERSRMLLHKHDGLGDDSLISAEHLTNRFNPDEFSHAHDRKFNWFPQYLERSGYIQAEQTNRKNAMLGDLLLGIATASVTNSVDPEDITKSSHSIVFSDWNDGPEIKWDVADTAGSSPDDEGKLSFQVRAIRSLTNHYFGSIVDESYLTARTDGAVDVLSHQSSAGILSNTLFETGAVHLRGGLITMDDIPLNGYLGQVALAGAIGAETFTFSTDSTRAVVSATEFEARLVTGETHTIELPITSAAILTTGGRFRSPFVAFLTADYTMQSPRIEATASGSGDLGFMVQIPHPEQMGFTFPNGVGIKSVELRMTAESSGGATDDPTDGKLRVVKVRTDLSTDNASELMADLGTPVLASASAFNRASWTATSGAPEAMDISNSYFITAAIEQTGDTTFGCDKIKVTYEAL